MKNIMTTIQIAALFLISAVFYLSTFTVQEYEQALILQLGKIQGKPITEAGLHFKIPFVQEIKFFEKRILQWDGDKSEIPTRDKKFIWVDTTARWKIKDAIRFYKSVRDVRNALYRMRPILDGSARDVVSNYNLIESVRNSNLILTDIKNKKEQEEGFDPSLDGSEDKSKLHELASDIEVIQYGREKLSEMIAKRARKQLLDIGIEIIDVQIRSIAYQKKVEKTVYNSMISERKQIATKIRSTGKGEEAKILGQLELKLKRIESEAYRKSELVRGKADAESTRIYAEAYTKDANYYAFLGKINAYKKTLSSKDRFILSTDSSFFDLLQKGK